VRVEHVPGKILAAWSGGPDSTAMVRLLLDAGCNLAAAHVNYGLRGQESDADEEFVRFWGEKWGVKLHVLRANVADDVRGCSLQEAARTIRYRFFEDLAHTVPYDRVALGHTADDVVETRVYSLLRSKHFNPLAGIPPRRSIYFRPLLSYNRQQILHFLSSRSIPFRSDSSNFKSDYLRNKIRLEILPKFAEINPSYSRQILFAGSLADDQARLLRRLFIRSGILENDFLDGVKLHRYTKRYGNEFKRLFLFQRLKELYALNSSEVDTVVRLCDAQTGKSAIVGGMRVIKERNGLLFSPAEVQATETFLITDRAGEGRFEKWKLRFGTEDFPGEGFRADAAKLRFPLIVRWPRPGDAYVPLGMKGRKKVFDAMTDMKVPASEKRRRFVVADCEGVIYLQGYRPAERIKIDSDTVVAFYFRFIE
jgi:tRNA(Ile)-lysidine synthase